MFASATEKTVKLKEKKLANRRNPFKKDRLFEDFSYGKQSLSSPVSTGELYFWPLGEVIGKILGKAKRQSPRLRLND